MSSFATTLVNETQPVQEMDEFEKPSLEPQPYHCCAEWHLARLGGACTVVHPFALHIAHSTKTFACSAVSLGPFLNCNESTIRRAFHKLEQAGFFEKIMQGTFGPSTYRVLNHQEWAAKHPNQCPEKFDYHWSQDGDPLARALWVASGTRVKFQEFQVRNLRALGITDTQIVAAFDHYMLTSGQRKKARNVPCGFYLQLKSELKNTGCAAQS